MPRRTEVKDGASARRSLLAGAPVSERRLEVAGVSTAFLEAGTGAPVVLLHGQGAWAGAWLPVIPPLAATHRVVAPDLPGLGASGTRVPPGAPDVVAWLGGLVDATCESPPVVVGMSLGARVAVRFAAAHPDRVSRLVLVASGAAGRVRPPPSVMFALVRQSVRPGERALLRFLRHASADIDRVRRQLGDRWEPFVAYLLDRACDPAVRRANRTLLRTLGLAPMPVDDVARAGIPTALVWGRRDRVMPVGAAVAMAERYGWPLHIVEDGGHIVALDRPAEFVRALRGALGT